MRGSPRPALLGCRRAYFNPSNRYFNHRLAIGGGCCSRAVTNALTRCWAPGPAFGDGNRWLRLDTSLLRSRALACASAAASCSGSGSRVSGRTGSCACFPVPQQTRPYVISLVERLADPQLANALIARRSHCFARWLAVRRACSGPET